MALLSIAGNSVNLKCSKFNKEEVSLYTSPKLYHANSSVQNFPFQMRKEMEYCQILS